MKIKRTKTGTKTSDSKHEIVKSEQNGNLNNEDASANNSKKPVNPLSVPASPSSSANKRGNNSHRKDKVRSLYILEILPSFMFYFFREKISLRLKINQILVRLLQIIVHVYQINMEHHNATVQVA